jgi:hypothetical protein
LLERPRWDWQKILNFPEQILSERSPVRPPGRGLTPTAGALVEKLLDMKRRFSSMADQYDEEVLMEFTTEDWAPIVATVEGIESAFKEFKGLMDNLRQRDVFIGV